MRLFVALCLEDDVRSLLMQATERIRKQAVRGHFTKPSNLHLTLHFLGETERFSNVYQAMDDVRMVTFPLKISGLGRFHRPEGDVMWAGVHASEALLSLHRQLSAALLARGFTVEDREYKPHLTLGRQVTLQTNWDAVQQINFPSMSMTVRRMHLMKSERINGELEYTSVYERAFQLEIGEVST